MKRLLVAVLLTVFSVVDPVQAAEREMKLSEQYQTSLFACHTPQKSLKVLGEETVSKHGTVFYLIRGDRNYDGAQDTLMLFDTKPGAEDVATLASPFPHYYIYDTDFDGLPDKAYRDVNGNGECAGMQEIPLQYLLSDPQAKATKDGQ